MEYTPTTLEITMTESPIVTAYDIYRWSTGAWLGRYNGESALDAYNAYNAKGHSQLADDLPEDILILALAGPEEEAS